MNNNRRFLFRVEEGTSFVVTTESQNIYALQKASEKYRVNMPDVEIIIIYNGNTFDFYFGLENNIMIKNPLSLSGQSVCLPTYCEDPVKVRRAVQCLLSHINHLDGICWNGMVKKYLEEKGIEYKEN